MGQIVPKHYTQGPKLVSVVLFVVEGGGLTVWSGPSCVVAVTRKTMDKTDCFFFNFTAGFWHAPGACSEYYFKGSRDHESVGATYEAHNAHVMRVVSPERLLLWNPRDGWEPLCKFLDVPVPDMDVPCVNESAMFERTLMALFVNEFKYVLKRVSAMLVGAIALGWLCMGSLGSITALVMVLAFWWHLWGVRS